MRRAVRNPHTLTFAKIPTGQALPSPQKTGRASALGQAMSRMPMLPSRAPFAAHIKVVGGLIAGCKMGGRNRQGCHPENFWSESVLFSKGGLKSHDQITRDRPRRRASWRWASAEQANIRDTPAASALCRHHEPGRLFVARHARSECGRSAPGQSRGGRGEVLPCEGRGIEVGGQ
jgi:hypothetical protein